MRTYKFRGQRVDNKEWVYGKLVRIEENNRCFILPLGKNIYQDEKPNYIQVFAIEVIPETVGQFTGLTDKNGKEIYEGDIMARKEVCK